MTAAEKQKPIPGTGPRPKGGGGLPIWSGDIHVEFKGSQSVLSKMVMKGETIEQVLSDSMFMNRVWRKVGYKPGGKVKTVPQVVDVKNIKFLSYSIK